MGRADAAEFFVGLIAADGTVIAANRAVPEGSGQGHEQVVGRPFWDAGWWHGCADLQAWLRGGVDQARRGEPFWGESSYLEADGISHLVECACTPMKDDTGHVRLVVQTGSDVDARHDATERRIARESDARFRDMANTGPAVVWMSSADGSRTFLSKCWYQITGQSPDGGLGFGWLDAVVTDERATVDEAFRLAFGSRERFQLEYRLKGRDGSCRSMLDVAEPWCDGAGQFLGFIGSVTDVTEQKRAEQALVESNIKKGQFIATLAHELRNPLAPIRNAVSVLREKGSTDADLQWYAEVIDRQVDQLVRLLEDLLDVSWVTRGTLRAKTERVSLSAVIDAAVQLAQPQIDLGKHALKVAIPPDPMWLDGDPARLAQVFSNLLTNAAKYTPPQGKIRLTAERHGDEIVVTVKDTGIGISDQHLPRIFEMFSQVEGALDRTQSGLGIGLSLVRGLVEMHGGRVTAESEGLGHGSTFTVRLPLRAELSTEEKTGRRAQEGTGEPTCCRVLVVDDNHDGADTLSLLLTFMGHDVRTAYDGEEGVAIAEEYHPQVVLLDVGMPKLNGYDACRRIRQQPWSRGVIVVACTGWGQEEDRRRTEEAGFNYHVVKPVDTVALEEIIQSASRSDAQST